MEIPPHVVGNHRLPLCGERAEAGTGKGTSGEAFFGVVLLFYLAFM